MKTRRRGQRGSVRIESGSYYGYFNTWSDNATTGERMRKQQCVRLGAKSAFTKFDAYKELAKHIERAGATNTHIDGSVSLVRFVNERWLPTKSSRWRSFTDERGRVSNSSETSAKHILSHILKRFGSMPLQQIDSVALQKWLNELAREHSESLVRHSRYYLRSIFDWAVWEEIIRRSPAKFLTLPRTKPVEKATLSVVEFHQVLAELDAKHALLVKVAVFCAFRPSELLALKWTDFDHDRKMFTISGSIVRGVWRPYTKTTERDEPNPKLLQVAVPDGLTEELMTYLKHGDIRGQYIFSNSDGGPLHKENLLHRVFQPVRKKLGLRQLNFQTLRRTCATLAQHAGSIRDISTHLRHRSPSVTAIEYTMDIPEGTREAVNIFYEVTKPKD